MAIKLPRGARTILLTSVLFGSFASSGFAHNCYNANKPDGAGAVTSLEEVWVNKGGKEVIPGAFVNPSIWGEEGYKDIFIRNYLDKAAKNGSKKNGIQEYEIPEEE
ncbi:hypothetical protein MHZ92_17075 [Sporosarcina sp. ACRSL]|uniref:hypothetical protein n=1 Tax=Sporosarcina sp. ACRSL TaxID=2918215 RepID=UPI001EF3EF9D|nr:hypothetical protein [Sporosarcina sp. ACRSL]MCG7345827.1 hypothetical protein [Sporosarcina sp. ACRSL]